jgi:U3 small nucleolar RNA-associated protein 21
MTKILALRYHHNSDLIALSCDDGSIRVLDITTKKLIRELWASRSDTDLQTLDYTFSNDGRWIISAASDSAVRVWDLPTGHLIDAMKLPRKCNTVAFSPSGEYLATGLDGEVGVHIWTNRTLFTHVSTRQITEGDFATVSAPTASGEGGVAIVEAAAEEQPEDSDEDETTVPIMDQLSNGITTLSLVPKSRWQTLLHLDIIRARNKPKEAPKAPEKAPFFLPSVGQTQIQGADNTSALDSEPKSRISSSALASRSSTASSTDEFTRHLARAAETAEYLPVLTYLGSLGASAADVAIRTLNTTEPYTELRTFIQALTQRLSSGMDYEVVQTWMNVLLRLHGDVLFGDDDLRGELAKYQHEAKTARDRLGGLVAYNVGVVGWVRSAR